MQSLAWIATALIVSGSSPVGADVFGERPFWESAPVERVSVPKKTVKAAPKRKRTVKRTTKKPVQKARAVPVDPLTPGPLAALPRCQPAFRAVGDQGATFDQAKDAARKAWQQQARFSFGERYADPGNAESVTFECVQSGTGGVTGGLFNRCEMFAKPCAAPKLGTQNP